MPDGQVQLCLPAQWSGTSIEDMTAGLRQVIQTYLLAQPHNYRCACNSYKNACLYSMCQMVGCNCHKLACCFRAKFEDMGAATCLIVSWSCYIYNCWPGVLVSDMCAGSMPHNQTCVMVKMSTDPVAKMAGLLVWYKYNRHAHWSNAWVPSIPVSRVQL